MKKRILIDASTISLKTDGLTCYIINILKNFPAEIFDVFDMAILINPAVKRADMQEIIADGKFRVIEAIIPPIGPRRDIAMWKFWRKQRKNFDVFHSTSNQYPLCIKNGIATIHDITFKFYFNERWFTFGAARHYLDLVIRNSLKNAGSIIAVSRATKDSLVKTYHLPEKSEDKITVIYEGWEHLISDEHAGATAPVGGRYLFYVGTGRKHKNMKGLLKAFMLALPSLPDDVNLVLSGSDDHLDEEDKNITQKINKSGKRVIFTGYVSKAELEALFKGAAAFIFPSFCEGFGIPVLESFYFGKPLLCSNSTSLPEIAGEAAIYFDPESDVEIADAMIGFFKDPQLSRILSEKGRERLKAFSWKKAAMETFALYKTHFEKYPKQAGV